MNLLQNQYVYSIYLSNKLCKFHKDQTSSIAIPTV